MANKFRPLVLAWLARRCRRLGRGSALLSSRWRFAGSAWRLSPASAVSVSPLALCSRAPPLRRLWRSYGRLVSWVFAQVWSFPRARLAGAAPAKSRGGRGPPLGVSESLGFLLFVASLRSRWRRTIPTRSRAHPFPLVRPLRLGSRPVRARLSGSSDSRTGSPAFFFRAIPTFTRVSDNVHYQTQAGRSARFKPASVIIDVIRRGFRHWTLRGPLAALSRLAFRARASPALRPTAPLRARNLFAAVLLRAALEPPSVAPTKQRGIPAAHNPKPNTALLNTGRNAAPKVRFPSRPPCEYARGQNPGPNPQQPRPVGILLRRRRTIPT